jgi:hypothetical protein
MVEADVYIKDMGHRSKIISEYYEKSGSEVAGQFQVKARSPQTFRTMEDIVDKMLTSTAWVQLIVCHGEDDHGLLMPLTREGTMNRTGDVIYSLAILAERASGVNTAKEPLDNLTKDVASKMGMPIPALMRLVEKLGELRKKKYFQNIVEIRGCHLGADPFEMMQAYRRTFGTHMFSAPICRQLFLRVKVWSPTPRGTHERNDIYSYLHTQKTTMQELRDGKKPPGKIRRRVFDDAKPEPIIVDVRDNDGHTHVEGFAFMDNPANAALAARKLIVNWNQATAGPGSDEFILPVMWDDKDDTFYVPSENGYNWKIKTVTY